jgi:hypothetical protein
VNDLYFMDVDGQNVRKVTDNADVPAWSPDGTQVAFLRFAYPPGEEGVWVRDLDAGEERRVSDSVHGSYLSKPDWQPIVNRPPDCSAITVTPARLWPPNHKLRVVSLGGATDPDGDEVTITIGGVTQDEPVGDEPDAQLGQRAGQVLLRAERDSKGDGRVYTINLTAADGKGGSCSGRTTVEVRRRQQSPAGDSSPPSYDSFSN